MEPIGERPEEDDSARKTTPVRLAPEERALLERVAELLAGHVPRGPGLTEILRDSALVFGAWLLREELPPERRLVERRWREALRKLLAARASEPDQVPRPTVQGPASGGSTITSTVLSSNRRR